ncbi:hypothetical protein [Rickettsia endosymbiont of Orchestes rusci]
MIIIIPYKNRHCERPKALLHGSKKVPYVIPAFGLCCMAQYFCKATR